MFFFRNGYFLFQLFERDIYSVFEMMGKEIEYVVSSWKALKCFDNVGKLLFCSSPTPPHFHSRFFCPIYSQKATSYTFQTTLRNEEQTLEKKKEKTQLPAFGCCGCVLAIFGFYSSSAIESFPEIFRLMSHPDARKIRRHWHVYCV